MEFKVLLLERQSMKELSLYGRQSWQLANDGFDTLCERIG